MWVCVVFATLLRIRKFRCFLRCHSDSKIESMQTLYCMFYRSLRISSHSSAARAQIIRSLDEFICCFCFIDFCFTFDSCAMTFGSLTQWQCACRHRCCCCAICCECHAASQTPHKTKQRKNKKLKKKKGKHRSQGIIGVVVALRSSVSSTRLFAICGRTHSGKRILLNDDKVPGVRCFIDQGDHTRKEKKIFGSFVHSFLLFAPRLGPQISARTHTAHRECQMSGHAMRNSIVRSCARVCHLHACMSRERAVHSMKHD